MLSNVKGFVLWSASTRQRVPRVEQFDVCTADARQGHMGHSPVAGSAERFLSKLERYTYRRSVCPDHGGSKRKREVSACATERIGRFATGATDVTRKLGPNPHCSLSKSLAFIVVSFRHHQKAIGAACDAAAMQLGVSSEFGFLVVHCVEEDAGRVAEFALRLLFVFAMES